MLQIKTEDMLKSKGNSTDSIENENKVKSNPLQHILPSDFDKNQEEQTQKQYTEGTKQVQEFTSLLDSPKKLSQQNSRDSQRLLRVEQQLRSQKKKCVRLLKIISSKTEKQRQLLEAYQQIAKKKIQEIMQNMPQQYKINKQQLKKNIEELTDNIKAQSEQLHKERQEKEFYKLKYEALDEQIKRKQSENVDKLFNKVYQDQIQELHKKIMELEGQLRKQIIIDEKHHQQVPFRPSYDQASLSNQSKAQVYLQQSHRYQIDEKQRGEVIQSQVNIVDIFDTKRLNQQSLQYQKKIREQILNYSESNMKKKPSQINERYSKKSLAFQQFSGNNLSAIQVKTQMNQSVQQFNQQLILRNSHQSSQEFRFSPLKEQYPQAFYSICRDKIAEDFGNCDGLSRHIGCSIDSLNLKMNILQGQLSRQSGSDQYYSILEQKEKEEKVEQGTHKLIKKYSQTIKINDFSNNHIQNTFKSSNVDIDQAFQQYNKQEEIQLQASRKKQSLIKHPILIQFVIKTKNFITNIDQKLIQNSYINRNQGNRPLQGQTESIRILSSQRLKKQLQNMEIRFVQILNRIRLYQKEFQRSLLDKDLQLKDARNKLATSYQKLNESQQNLALLKLYYQQLQYKMISSSAQISQNRQSNMSISNSMTKNYLKSIIRTNTKLIDYEQNKDMQVQCCIDNYFSNSIAQKLQKKVSLLGQAIKYMPKCIKEMVEKHNLMSKQITFDQYSIDLSENLKDQIQSMLNKLTRLLERKHASQAQRKDLKEVNLNRKKSIDCIGSLKSIQRSNTNSKVSFKSDYDEVLTTQNEQLIRKLSENKQRLLQLSQKVTAKNIQLKKKEEQIQKLNDQLGIYAKRITGFQKSMHEQRMQRNKSERGNSQSELKERLSEDSYMQFEQKKQFNNLNSDKDKEINMLKERLNEYEQELIRFRLQKKKKDRRTIFLNH